MTTLRLGKLLGIELRLDYSWFLIFLLLTWSLAGHYLMVNAGWSAGVRLSLALVTALLFPSPRIWAQSRCPSPRRTRRAHHALYLWRHGPPQRRTQTRP
jgi:hypothetical protein